MSLRRRQFLGGSFAASLASCGWRDDGQLQGKDVNRDHELGHRLRLPKLSGTPYGPEQSCAVAIVGAGVSGLAALRALHRQGIEDVQVFELAEHAGGNSRGHMLGGMACPLGAHYLPVPSAHDVQTRALLQDLGILQVIHGRDVYDQTMLCASPQERLWMNDHWQPGLLPLAQDVQTEQQYRAFAQQVDAFKKTGAFAIPAPLFMHASSQARVVADLDALTFDAWLDKQGLNAPALRWYLNYCCKDEYGAGTAVVSAWAGVHYFASRHGFHAADSAVLTWPSGNGYLTERMAKPFPKQIRPNSLVQSVEKVHQTYRLEVFDAPTQILSPWRAQAVVLAVPFFVAQKMLRNPPNALLAAHAALHHSAWWTANLLLDQPLLDTAAHDEHVPMAWDNVIYQGAGLGYVNAMHQSLRSHAGGTVLTYYQAWGTDPQSRTSLQKATWQQLAELALQDLQTAHPDLQGKTRQVDVMRFGHAMAVPQVGSRRDNARTALQTLEGTLQFAHSDLAGYSIFEEALHHGTQAGLKVARALHKKTV